jgi:lipoprotein LprG
VGRRIWQDRAVSDPGNRPASTTERPVVVTLALGAFAVSSLLLLFAFAVIIGVIGPGGSGDAVVASGDAGGLGDLSGLGDSSVDDDTPADPDAQADEVVAAAAAAMGMVTSAAFELELDGSPVFIDQFGSIAVRSLIGRFTVPNRAVARLDVVVDASLATRIGAIAIDEEVWISNPVTGTFETLPPGYDIDPSRFFDPTDGWQPLLEGLTDVELAGVDDRDGDRYRIAATAPAALVSDITAGLVDDQDVPIELWIHPGSSLVTAARLTTTIDGGETTWDLELGRYGETFTIDPPEAVS